MPEAVVGVHLCRRTLGADPWRPPEEKLEIRLYMELMAFRDMSSKFSRVKNLIAEVKPL